MSAQEIAISVKHVSKNFVLPHEQHNSIKDMFVNVFKKKDKSYDIQHALKDISFDIPKGEFFGIVGRNGSGKSTLLKIIAGIYQPTKGTVKVNGRLVPFIELGVGFNPELTGRENIYLNGALMNFSESEVTAKYNEIVEFAELEQFMDQKLKNYSSGMQVRLAFSAATILADSEVLLIDEVLAVGDADFQRKCFEYFRMLKKQKKTVVFVSHDMSAIRDFCDRAVLIDKSKIIHMGSADQVAKEYTKLFLPDAYQAEQEAARVRRHNELKQAGGKIWGSGGASIENITTSRKLYNEKDGNISISYDIICDSDFSDVLIPGFIVKDEKGERICGNNSEIVFGSKSRLQLSGGEKMTITWTFPNIFGQGRFFLDVAVLSGSNSDTLVWWEDADSFRVNNEQDTPFPVSPKVTLSIE